MAVVAVIAIGLVRRVVRFTFRLVVLVGVLALFAGVLKLQAQTISIVPFLKHGEWNAIGLNNGSEIRLVFDQDDDCLRCNSEISSGPVGELYAQVTVTRFFGIGPASTLNFTGQLVSVKDAAIFSERYGMPNAGVVCGTLFNVRQESLCFLFQMGYDGYSPGGVGSKLYNVVLTIKIIRGGSVAFDGQLRNPVSLLITADGEVVW